MARITFFDALGENGFITAFYDAASLKVVHNTTTEAVMKDVNGARVVFTGTDLAFDGQTPTSGTITGIVLFDSQGSLLTKVTQSSILAVDLFTQFQSLGLFGVELAVIAGDDRIFGSGLGDFILGQDGADMIHGGAGNDGLGSGNQNDTLFGGAGDDVLSGGKGRDTMTGDDGADGFLFMKKDGTDTITDFTDTGARDLRDHIQIRQNQYHDMTATQDGADLDLFFGGKDHLVLLGFNLADLDRSDFTLG